MPRPSGFRSLFRPRGDDRGGRTLPVSCLSAVDAEMIDHLSKSVSLSDRFLLAQGFSTKATEPGSENNKRKNARGPNQSKKSHHRAHLMRTLIPSHLINLLPRCATGNWKLLQALQALLLLLLER